MEYSFDFLLHTASTDYENVLSALGKVDTWNRTKASCQVGNDCVRQDGQGEHTTGD
jgi:hypothetical protein